MTMTPYNTDLTRALKWLHNNAPNLQSIIQQKANWYQKYNTQFWVNWQANVFDIRTANAFGLVVWCIILGLPLDIFDFEPITNAFAYGAQRGNYLDGGGNVVPINFVDGPVIYGNGTIIPSSDWTLVEETDGITFNPIPAAGVVLSWTGTVKGVTGQTMIVQQPRVFGTGDGTTSAFRLTPSNSGNYNEVGNNFYGGGDNSVSLLTEIRQACQLRYVALVSNGRQQWINQMLQYIFNAGEAWNFPAKEYFYLTDTTMAQQPVTGAQIWRSDWQGNQLMYTTSRTNSLWPSNEIATTNDWAETNCALANSAGPDGTANGAVTLTPTASAVAYVEPTNPIAADLNTIYTASVFVKQGTATSSTVEAYNNSYSALLGQATISWAGGIPSVSGTGGTGYVAGTASVAAAGVAGWYRVQFAFNSLTNADLSIRLVSDATNTLGTTTYAYPQVEQGQGATAYIGTTTAAKTVATEYTLTASTGAVVMTAAPLNNAILTWMGTWNWATWTAPSQFGTGNGSNVDFTLTNPPGGAVPVATEGTMQYRIGANMGISSQFLTLMNTPSYGIMPQCAGTSYTVVQES